MAKSQNSRDYWAERAIRRSSKLDDEILLTSPKIANIYNDVFHRIDSKINETLDTLASRTGASVDILRELAPRGKIDQYFKTAREFESQAYLASNYSRRISNLELLKHEIHTEIKRAYAPELAIHTKHHGATINSTGQRFTRDLAKTTSPKIAFNAFDARRAEYMLGQKWAGRNYKQSVWRNNDILARDISERLTAGLIANEDRTKLIREIRDKFGVHTYQASRLVRTETTYFENQIERELAQELDITHYRFSATLDTRTSDICGHMDGEIIPFAKAEVGYNFPPLHPNCRSKALPYLGKDFEPTERYHRDDSELYGETGDFRTYKNWEAELPPIEPPNPEEPTAYPEITPLRRAHYIADYTPTIQQAVFDIRDTYPQALEGVDNITMTSLPAGTGAHYMPPQINGDPLHFYNGTIEINTNRKLKTANEAKRANYKSGYLSTKTVKGTVYHEFGHALHFQITQLRKGAQAYGELLDFYRKTRRNMATLKRAPKQRAQANAKLKELRKDFNTERIDPVIVQTLKDAGLIDQKSAPTFKQLKPIIRKEISQYASTNPREIFAELFGGMMENNKKPIYKHFRRNLDAELRKIEFAKKPKA